MLEADDRGRTRVLSGGLATSRSSSSRSSCSIHSGSEAGGSNVSSSSTTAGTDGCQSPGATAAGRTPPEAEKRSSHNLRPCASYVEGLAFDPRSPGHAGHEVGNSFQPLPPGAVPQRLGE
eukprot:7581921-Pyramimonas_sp.AAC.1